MNPAETTAPVTPAIGCRRRSAADTARRARAGTRPVHRQRPQVRAGPIAIAASGTPAGRPSTCSRPHAPRLMQVLLDPRRQRRDLQLLERPGYAQIPAALARALRVVIDHLVRLGLAHRQTTARPAACPACARHVPRHAVAAGTTPGRAGHPTAAASRNCHCSATPSAPAARPAPAAQRSPPAAPLAAHPAQRTTRNPGQQEAERTQAMIIDNWRTVSKPTDHSPQGSRLRG